jgi:seryl-tRNA synthetase
MLDVRRLRAEPDEVRDALARKGVDATEVDRAIELDEARRKIAERRDRVRNLVNHLSKEVGRLRGGGDAAAAEEKMAESRALGDEERALAAEGDGIAAELHDLLLRIPNTPDPAAPDGAGEADNVVVRVVGHEPDAYGEHQRVPHWEIGADLGLLDLERGARIAGSMFPLYRGAGAKLLRALTWWALERHGDAFEEIRPPTLVRSETLTASGQLPKFADDAYHVERDDLWAIPTGEVPLTSMGRDEILSEEALPVRMMAATACYRREAGSAGRDTRGVLRSHEFDKVEVLAYATPEQAPDLLVELLGRAESMLVDLGLAYRVLDICTGDMGQTHHRSFDLEVYSPGCDLWLEVSSVSWFSEYQARRANVRFRRAATKKVEPVHTLNGSALAWSRIWPAILETHRRPDGSIALPEPLRPFFGGSDTLARPPV